MRKKVNTISIILFVAFSILALAFGWIDDNRMHAGESRTWFYCLLFTALTLVVGVVRFALFAKARKKEMESYIPIRSVTICPSVAKENGVETELADKVPLIYIDNVHKDKVVISLYKHPVALVNCPGKVNEQ